MEQKALNARAGKRFFNKTLKSPDKFPFTFVYDGVEHRGFEGLKAERTVAKGEGEASVEFRAKLDESMQVSVKALLREDFGQTEYTVWFENVGSKPTAVLSDVYALDFVFEGKAPVLRGNLGDHENWYAAYEHDLTRGDKYFLSKDGRATHKVFPYFDLVHGGGGTMLALGWAGTWEALFSAGKEGTRVRARTDVPLSAALLPGEKVRTGLVAFLPYKGRDYAAATNLWRAWYMQYNLPRANAAGDPLLPFSTAGFAMDTGLPNSDGSISERWFTWKPTLEKLEKERVLPDFRWFDAGWYSDPKGRTVESDWWGTVGSWELDREKWPDGSFRVSNEACHSVGMKVLVWFEPERVTDVQALAENYGYKEEWGIGEGDVRANDLGDPECLAWTLGRITKFMDENAVDMYREDNNSSPGVAWPFKDRLESEKYGLPRDGMTENKCICGHYALWDGIIEYCRKTGKCTFVDSCASGGGRNDLESMRRGFPLMRSDFDRTTSSMRLSQTSTLCRWLPFHGSTVKETETQLGVSEGAGNTSYVNRASYLPIYNFIEAFTHNDKLDYDLMRRNLEEWKSIRHLLVKDMYVLTPWRHDFDTDHWTAFAYDDPDKGESILLAFRMETAKEQSFTVRLPFVQPGSDYILRDADTGEAVRMSWRALSRRGFTVTLPEPKSSAMFRITRL